MRCSPAQQFTWKYSVKPQTVHRFLSTTFFGLDEQRVWAHFPLLPGILCSEKMRCTPWHKRLSLSCAVQMVKSKYTRSIRESASSISNGRKASRQSIQPAACGALCFYLFDCRLTCSCLFFRSRNFPFLPSECESRVILWCPARVERHHHLYNKLDGAHAMRASCFLL